jgi:DNA-binding CsgD family transcriptional regulator/tetratricopeptide (TPR) repeat protein
MASPRTADRRSPLCPVLIGRDDLLALAERRLTAARSGAGHLLFLAGEAGIGKTRLLTELCDRAVADGFTVVTAAAYPRDAETVGGVLAELAAALRRQPGMAGAGQRMARRLADVGGAVGDAARQRRLLVADVADELAALTTEADDATPADGPRPPKPVLLALEDLHWADDLTLEVLDRVARRVAGEPVLLVGTYRSDELYPRVPMRTWRTRLLTQRMAEEARLARFSPDETAAMAAAIADGAVPVALAAAVHSRSDGIPLHVEEFLAILVEPAATGRSVPDTLGDAVLARAEALSGPARALVEAAAVIGRSFDVDLLTAVTGDSPERIDGALRELAERFFVQRRGDEPVYDFRHALIRDALYADLPPHRCRDLHARVAVAAVAAGFGDAFVSAQYERAAQPALAHRYAMAAGAEAASMSAHREAVDLYRRAERTTPSDTPVAARASLLVALGTELAAVDDIGAAEDAYARAYALRRDLGDDLGAAAVVPPLVAVRHLLGVDLDARDKLLQEAMALVAASQEGPAKETHARLLAGISAAYMLDRCLDDAIDFGRRARALAIEVGDRATGLHADASLGSALVFGGKAEGWRMLESVVGRARTGQLEAESARGYRMLGSCASVLVEYDRAERWLREGIAYADRTERLNDRHYMAAHLAHTLWATGDWPAADREARQALADGRGGVTTRITALHVLGYLALGRGDWSAADEHLHEARELGERMVEMQRLSPALWGLAESALHSGRLADAVKWCEKGYEVSSPAWDAAYLFPYVVTGTRAYLALDDPTGAVDWLDRCAHFLRYRSIPGTMPALEHARGLLHLADGHTGRARDALATAAAGWDERRRFWEGTQALLDRAVAAIRSRRPAEAADLAAEARERAARVAAAPLLARAGTGTRPRREPAYAGAQPLTAREVEVARLIATGATNRQVAEALCISPKTVAAHVEHILTKLGAARRTEIAAWAAAHTATG